MSAARTRDQALAAGLVPLLALAAGCLDYSISIEVIPPANTSLENMRLSAAIYLPGTGSNVTCDDPAFGLLSMEEMRSSLVGAVDLVDGAGTIKGVPFDGDKLAVVEGFDTGPQGDIPTSQQQRLVAGCALVESGDRPRDRRVQVQLEDAAWLHVLYSDERDTMENSAIMITVQVPWGETLPAQGFAAPALEISVRDHTDLVLLGDSAVMARVRGPSGTILHADRVEISGGQANYIVPVHFAGPFTVELTPRWGLGELPVMAYGFALSPAWEAKPFGDDVVDWAWPVRWRKNQAGFIAITHPPGNAGDLRVDCAIATGIGSQAGGPTFERSTPRSLADFPNASYFRYAGAAVGFDSTAPEGEALVLLQEVDNQGLPTSRLQPFRADGRSGLFNTVMLPAPSLNRHYFAVAVPVGPCPGRAETGADRDAAPVAISLLEYGDVGGTPTLVRTPLLFSDLRGNESASLNVRGLIDGSVTERLAWVQSSHCSADEKGVLHRIVSLWVQEEGGYLVVVDLDAGLTGGEAVAMNQATLDQKRRQATPIIALGDIAGDRGEPLLLSSTYKYIAVQIDAYGVLAEDPNNSEQEPVMRRVRTLTGDIFLFVGALTSGHLLDEKSRDIVTLFILPGEDDRMGGAFSVLSNFWGDPERAIYGIHSAPWPIDLEYTNFRVANVNPGSGQGQDQIDELLTVTMPDSRFAPTDAAVQLAVIRLQQW